ncbi:DUF305 domain-containing protein [uncultured Hymenobacter sp.]|uniref:DUF305 domain-containing protein n=1 Tax=uncultured Hymenobacter sp. TaxID=170016 RepID=UPI0035C945F6
MKKPALLLTAFWASALLLGSCNFDKPAATAAATTAATAAAVPASAADDMAGPDHQPMSGNSPLLAAMNDMMAKMSAEKPRGNTDHDFAHLMIAHHQGAVAMADIELREGQDATMRQLATKIKADQQQEIAALEPIAGRLDAAPTNYQPQNPADPFTSKMKASMAGMMKMPAMVADPDMNFNLLMTTHHQSAVDMARAEVAHGRDTRLRELAQRIIDAQQKEIQQFQAWQAKNASQLKPAAVRYECPMNDGGQAGAPGQCPKCGMALVKKT